MRHRPAASSVHCVRTCLAVLSIIAAILLVSGCSNSPRYGGSYEDESVDTYEPHAPEPVEPSDGGYGTFADDYGAGPSDVYASEETDTRSATTCVDVTSYDYNWDNDMLCTRSDGSRFYTDYAGAARAEAR